MPTGPQILDPVSPNSFLPEPVPREPALEVSHVPRPKSLTEAARDIPKVHEVRRIKATAVMGSLWVLTLGLLTAFTATLLLGLAIGAAAAVGAILGSAVGPAGTVFGLGLGAAVGIAIGIAVIALVTGVFLYRRQTKNNLEPFLKGIETARIDALMKSGDKNGFKELEKEGVYKTTVEQISGVQAHEYFEIEEFVNGVFALREKIQKLGGEKDQTDKVKSVNKAREKLKEVREDLSKLLSSRPYQALKERNDNPAATYLKEVSLQMISADGEKVIQEYGGILKGRREKKTGKPEEIDSCPKLAKSIKNELDMPNYNRDNKITSAWWLLTHLPEAIHSRISTQDPLGFNSHDGNSDYQGFTLLKNKDGNPIQFYYGPCQTGDPIFEHGILPAYKQFGLTEVRFNYQSTHKKSELARTRELHRMAEQYPDQLTVVTMPFDSKRRSEAGKKLFSETTVENFMEEFTSQIKEECRFSFDGTEEKYPNGLGYYIPEAALLDEQLDAALEASKTIAKSLIESELGKKLKESKKGIKSLKEILQIATDQVLHIAILDHKKPDKCSGACKEDVDRGPPMNLMMKAFAQLKEEPIEQFQAWLKEEGPALIAGLSGRGRHTHQKRDPLVKRVKLVLNLLKSMDTKQLEVIKSELTKAPPALKEFAKKVPTSSQIWANEGDTQRKKEIPYSQQSNWPLIF